MSDADDSARPRAPSEPLCVCCDTRGSRYHPVGWMCGPCWRVAIRVRGADSIVRAVVASRGLPVLPEGRRLSRPTRSAHRPRSARGPGRPFKITQDHELILRRCAEELCTVKLLAEEIVDRPLQTVRAMVWTLESRGMLSVAKVSASCLYATTDRGLSVVAERDANEGVRT